MEIQASVVIKRNERAEETLSDKCNGSCLSFMKWTNFSNDKTPPFSHGLWNFLRSWANKVRKKWGRVVCFSRRLREETLNLLRLSANFFSVYTYFSHTKKAFGDGLFDSKLFRKCVCTKILFVGLTLFSIQLCGDLKIALDSMVVYWVVVVANKIFILVK